MTLGYVSPPAYPGGTLRTSRCWQEFRNGRVSQRESLHELPSQTEILSKGSG